MKFCLALTLLGSLDATLRIVCGALLACLALVLPFVWLGEKGVRPFHALLVLLRALPLAGRILLCGLFCAGGYVFGSKFLPPPASAPVATCLSEGGGMSAVSDPPVGAAPRLRTLELWSPPLPPPVPQTFPRPALTGIVPTPTSVLLRAEWPGESAYTGRYVEFLAKPDLSTSDWVRVGGARAGSWERGVAVELPRALLPFDASRAAFFSFDGGVDADGDGMPDGWELAHGLSPEEPSDATADLDGDGFPNLVEFLMDADPSDAEGVAHGFAFQAPGIPASLSAWTVSPADFRFSFPGGTGRVIAERTFRVDRTTPAQQLFVSSDPGTGSWMDRGGWDGWDVEMSYSIDGGPFIGAPSVSAAAWCLPLGPDPVGTVTVRLSAASDEPCLSTPLYLVRWTPQYVFAEGEGVQILRGTNGAEVVSARRDAASADFRIHARVDLSSLPGGCVAPEAGLFVSPAPGLRVEVVDAAGGEVVLRADGPLWAELPPQGADAPVAICCWEVSCETSGDIDAGPRSSPTASPWPLSTAARRRAFHRARNLPSSGIASFSVLPDHPRVAVAVGAGRALRSAAPGGSCTCADDCASCTWAVLDGSVTLGRACFCHDGDGPPDEGPDPPVEVGGEDEPPQECGCGDGADDAPAEQLELGSLRLRVPLGSSASDGLYGYVWASLEEPAELSPDLFRVLGAAGVSASTNAFGEFTAMCSRPGGRTVAVSRIADGVAISVTNNASGRLEYRWEVANADDPDMYGAVRVRRLTVSGNPTSDETYCLDGGPPFEQPLPAGARVGREEPSRRTARWDALRGTWTSRASWRQDPSGPDFVTDEAEAVSLGGTQRVSCVVSEYAKLGSGAFTRRRLTRRFGYDASGPLDESRTYWTDGAHPLRHGRLRSLRSNREPWRLHEYDALGRESVRLEQLDGSPFPESLAEDDAAPSHLAALPEGCSARAAVTSYVPGTGDTADRNDRDLPRRREEYVLRAGAAPLLVRTETWTYARSADAAGVPLRTCTHTSVHGADASLPPAVDSRTEYPEGDYAVPAHLRGRVLSVTDADGVTATTAWERGAWDAATRAFAAAADGDFLRATSRRSRGDATDKTYAVEVSELSRRLVVHAETRLAADDAVLEWTSSAYDDVGRLRSRLYSDGTSETNAYSCCRLLWSQDRRGRKVLRSARTGTDDLYHAEEEVWLGDVSTNGTYRVTQHFADGLGRETATVTYAGSVPGEAQDPVEPDASQTPSRTSTAYPVTGGDEVVIRTDARGAVTTTSTTRTEGRDEVFTVVSTNGVTVSEEQTYSGRNGSTLTIRRIPAVPDGSGGELAPAQYLEERRWTEWGADGLRADFAATYTVADGLVTNSVTRHDHLGRVTTVTTPLSDVTNAYDGTSSRILFAFDAKSGVTTTCLYDELGEQVGSVEKGVTNTSVTTYAEISNAVWKVVAEAVVGPSTNGMTVTRTRLTGLSDACRSHVVTVTGTIGALAVEGVSTETVVSFDPATGVETESVESSLMGTRVAESLHGIERVSTDASGATTNRHDALGRLIRAEKGAAIHEYAYDATGALVEMRTPTGTNTLVEAYVYDALGRRTETVDALGQSTCTAYDAVGNVVAEGGATYPVRYEYDPVGRRTAFGMTLDGVVWNWTRWTHDPVTGLCIRKTYADGSYEAYTHTSDGLLETTTHSSGRWLRNEYDADRRLVRTTSGDGAQDASYGRDAYGRVVSESNAVLQTAYALDESGVATGESWNDCSNTTAITRSVDSQGRQCSLAVDVGYSQFIAYTPDNLVASVSNDEVVVSYAYADDRYETGYSLALASGMVFTRSVTRDPNRRELVTTVTNRCGAAVRGLVYTHDALSRPVSRNADAFGYNVRGEVVSARIGGDVESHVYDLSGNSILASFNAETNLYTANNLNQYTTVQHSAFSVQPSYDTDGNMTAYGPWSYAYDSGSRLVSVSSNGILLVTNFYDAKGRRIRKVAPTGTSCYVYDGWNLIRERVERTDGTAVEFKYFWGRDLSGTLQGAGGVGGLLYVTVDGSIYIPFADANGNVTAYADSTGTIVAEYAYDAFGRTISQTGPLSGLFRHRFSSKYCDSETELYYYGYRFYSSGQRRWLTQDPIGENGGANVYSYVENNPVGSFDALGLAVFLTLGGVDRSGAFADQSSHMRQAMSLTLAAVRRFDTIAKEEYDCLQKKGLVFFNGESFKGGFAQYKLKLSRELKSSVATCPTRRDFIARLKEVAKESTERYDYVYAAIHGEPSFGNKSTFVCVFKDEIVPQKKLRTDTMAAMLGASGRKDFVSCYQSAGKRETIRHWRWPKLDYMPGKKLDYQVHSIGRIQL